MKNHINRNFLDDLKVPEKCWYIIDIKLSISKNRSEKTFQIVTGNVLKFKPFLICNN